MHPSMFSGFGIRTLDTGVGSGVGSSHGAGHAGSDAAGRRSLACKLRHQSDAVRRLVRGRTPGGRDGVQRGR
jgi:hypothetical protein